MAESDEQQALDNLSSEEDDTQMNEIPAPQCIEESNEQQALDNLSSEEDDTQMNEIQATQCIEGSTAQALFIENLKEQIKHSQETCCSIRSANMKLKFEIIQAEQKIKSYQTCKETIRMANVELKTEFLIARIKKLFLIERIQTGEKRYEDLWLECKNRFESQIRHVQNLMKAAETAQNLKDKIATLTKQSEELVKQIEAKKEACRNVDRERIIQLAEFMVNERPKLIAKINEMSKALTDLTNERNLDINAVNETEVAEKAETDEEPNVAGIEENKSVDEMH